MEDITPITPEEFGPLLLDIGTSLLRSGASTGRVRVTMHRFVSATDFESHLHISPRSVTLTLNDELGYTVYSGTKSIHMQGVNFKVISGISRLGWSFVEEDLSLQDVRIELDRLASLPHYNRWIVLVLVALAGAAFCFNFGGGWFEMSMACLGTLCGLFVKQELVKRAFNTYIVTFLSALTAALITKFFYDAGHGEHLEHAISTCVLFLIPGVPMINSFTDLVDGYILNGVERGVNALMHAMAIAIGIALAMFTLNLFQ